MIHIWHHHHHEAFRKKEIELLEESVKLEREQRDDLHAIRKDLDPRLASIKVAFTEKNMGTTAVPPVPGPVVMDIGDVVVASIIGFDQFGAPWTGPIPTPTFSDDNEASSTLDETVDEITGVAAGVNNVTGSLTTLEGLALTDTETVTVRPAAPPPTPVLSSIKVAFTPKAAVGGGANPAVRR